MNPDSIDMDLARRVLQAEGQAVLRLADQVG